MLFPEGGRDVLVVILVGDNQVLSREDRRL